MKKVLIISFLFTVLHNTPSYSCTIIMGSANNVTLAGSNEDSAFPLTLLWFVPATEGNYGRVCLGYKMMMNSVQGGMNEKGLFLDGNSLGKQGWKPDKYKKALSGQLLDRILATCATVDEVKDFFHTYNTQALDQARIPVMDKSGASMIVEWYNGEVVFLETDKPYQISTNFVGSAYIGKEKPCWRYNKADEMLQDNHAFSHKILKDALNATHVENRFSSTVYSFICDLQKGEIEIYNYHDFSAPVTFSLRKELDKGAKEYYIGNLFPEKKEAYERFLTEGPVNMVEFGYYRINKMRAMMFYSMLKYQYPGAFNRDIDINVLSEVAKHLDTEGRTEDAVMFLERNRSEFPDAARAHFELANGYLKTNRHEKAIAEFKETLAINPDHKEARQALEQLVDQ